MRSATPLTSLRWLKVSIAVLLVLLAVAPFCAAAAPRSIHRQATVREAAGPSREIAEVSPGIFLAPPPRCGVLQAPDATGWLTPSGEPAFPSFLGSPSLHSRAPPAR